MADNVVDFGGITTLDIDPERVLKAAIGQLESVIIIGITKDGEEYFASSVANGPSVLWDLERAKLKLLQVQYED